MIISIDYDGTFTRDVSFWRNFCQWVKTCGHTIILTTGRGDSDADRQEIRNTIEIDIPVIFAGKRWKREIALEAGYNVDIWIDDMPEFVSDMATKPQSELWKPGNKR